MSKKVLMPVTAANQIELQDGSTHPTGFWAEELVVLHRGLRAAGYEVVIATPQGRLAPVDESSLNEEWSSYLEQWQEELSNPAVLEDMRIEDFAAVAIPGGHGPMVDLATNAALGELLAAAEEQGKLIGAVCHGPAALLSAQRDGKWIFAGRHMSAFSDAEERAGAVPNITWYLEQRMRELGGIVENSSLWKEHVVVDGNLVTGQNPQSSAAFTQKIVEILG